MIYIEEGFPIAKSYPQFFTTNLVDDNRVIKLVRGSQADLRVFYYQLFRLIMEIDMQRDQDELDYLTILKNVVEETEIGDKRKVMTPDHLKIIEDCLNQIGKEQQPSFEEFIRKNKKMEEAMVRLFQYILSSSHVLGASYKDRLQCLRKVFDINMNQHDNCLQFEQSDVYAYIEDPRQIYLAYLNIPDMEAAQQTSQGNQSAINNSLDKVIKKESRKNSGDSQPTPKANSSYQKKEENKNPETDKNDTIMNIFGDMLHSSKNQDSSKVYNSFTTSNLNNSNYAQMFTPSSKRENYGAEKFRIDEVINEKEEDVKGRNSKTAFQQTEQKSSKVEKFPINQDPVKQSLSTNKNSKVNGIVEEEGLFYNPKTSLTSNYNGLRTISEVTASKQSMLQSKMRRKDPLDYDNEEEKGTFYRQFTDTRILNILPQPQRSKVKMLKNRFIGVHRQDTIRRR